MNQEPTVEDMYQEGMQVLGCWSHKLGILHSGSPEDICFRGIFGASAEVVARAWHMMMEHDLLPPEPVCQHYLWALAFMCTYPKNDKALSRLLGNADPKTIRKYIWMYIDSLFDLNFHVVSFEFLV